MSKSMLLIIPGEVLGEITHYFEKKEDFFNLSMACKEIKNSLNHRHVFSCGYIVFRVKFRKKILSEIHYVRNLTVRIKLNKMDYIQRKEYINKSLNKFTQVKDLTIETDITSPLDIQPYLPEFPNKFARRVERILIRSMVYNVKKPNAGLLFSSIKRFVNLQHLSLNNCHYGSAVVDLGKVDLSEFANLRFLQFLSVSSSDLDVIIRSEKLKAQFPIKLKGFTISKKLEKLETVVTNAFFLYEYFEYICNVNTISLVSDHVWFDKNFFAAKEQSENITLVGSQFQTLKSIIFHRPIWSVYTHFKQHTTTEMDYFRLFDFENINQIETVEIIKNVPVSKRGFIKKFPNVKNLKLPYLPNYLNFKYLKCLEVLNVTIKMKKQDKFLDNISFYSKLLRGVLIQITLVKDDLTKQNYQFRFKKSTEIKVCSHERCDFFVVSDDSNDDEGYNYYSCFKCEEYNRKFCELCVDYCSNCSRGVCITHRWACNNLCVLCEDCILLEKCICCGKKKELKNCEICSMKKLSCDSCFDLDEEDFVKLFRARSKANSNLKDENEKLKTEVVNLKKEIEELNSRLLERDNL